MEEDEENMFFFDLEERHEINRELLRQIKTTRNWDRNSLNVFLRLDMMFNGNKDSLKRFLDRLQTINAKLLSKHSAVKDHFNQIIGERFSDELNNIKKLEYLEQQHYLSLITMLYVVFEYCGENKDWFNQVFQLHNPRMLDYFKLLNSLFENKKRIDLCNHIIGCLKKLDDCTLSIGFNALVTLANLERSFEVKNLLDFSWKYQRTYPEDQRNQREIISVIQWYYDFFSRDEKIGALFLNYVPVKSDPILNVYFHGHDGKEGFFSLKTYIIYIGLCAIKKDVKDEAQILSKLVNHVARNSAQNTHLHQEEQLNLSEAINGSLYKMLEKNTKHFELIIKLVELNLNIILRNRTFTREDANRRLIRSASMHETQPENFKTIYKRLIAFIGLWLQKECNETLLVNYGLETKFTTRFQFLAKDAMDVDEHPLFYSGTRDEAKLYNLLFNLNLPPTERNLSQRAASSDYNLSTNAYHDDLCKIYKERLRERVEVSFREIAEFKAKFDFNRFQPNDITEKLSFIFDSVLFDYLTTKQSPEDIDTLCRCLMQEKSVELNEYILRLLNEKWPKQNNKLLVNNTFFILNWPVYLAIYKNQITSNPQVHTLSLLDNTKYPNLILLNFEWNSIYKRSFDHLIDLFIKVSSGQASVEDIELINANLTTARNLFDFLKENSNYFGTQMNFENFNRLIATRVKEVNEFRRYIKNMKLFLQFCTHFDKIDRNKYETLLNDLMSLKAFGSLNLYCEILPVDNISQNTQDYTPNITYFKDIDIKVMNTIDRIVSLDRSKCVIFDVYFSETLDEENSNKPIENAITKLWETTHEKWKSLAHEIQNESIKLTKLDYIYEKYFQSHFENMHNELKYVIQQYFRIKHSAERLDQIKLWYNFKSSYDAAKAIKFVKDTLLLSDSFVELNDLLQISSDAYQTWELNRMKDQIRKTVDCLRIMNKRANLDCLIAFSESLELVNWLRDKIRGLSQFKTFVDSLSISAALDKTPQGNERKALAKTLREAGTAYAALIYELNKADDFTRFMQLCAQVCTSLESDAKIAQKLRQVSFRVKLFDDVLVQAESAEKNKLIVAKDFNKHGIYVIESKTGYEDSIEQIIKLKLADTETTYQDLKEIQNVLLLIAPQTNENSDDIAELKYFTQMLEFISQLAIKYLRLIEYGCVYFDEFKIEIKCDFLNSSAERCRVNDLSDDADTSLNYATYLIKYLDNAFLIWSKHIHELRNQYDCLNYFTIKQLKYIVKHLKINNRKLECDSFPFIKAILFNLNPYLTMDKLNQAFSQPFKHQIHEYNFDIDATLSNRNFSRSLEQNWLKFLNEQNATSLSLKHLACLFDLIKVDTRVRRIIPGYLNHKGEPNLIKCRQNKQIPIVLSMYSCSPDQPLPTNDEILFCDSNTTYEELEIFLRRAFKSSGDRIYTALNVQSLKYESTTKLEAFLVANQIEKTDTFVLVFISCGSSAITSFYTKNLIKPIELTDKELTGYLDLKLQTRNRMLTLNSHNINNKSYSVKGLLSKRSGNGKSAYVDEFKKRLNHKFNYEIIRIKASKLDINNEIEKFFKYYTNETESKSTIYHIDMAHEVFYNVDHYLFNLIVCGYLKNSINGKVWRRDSLNDLYLIEMSPPFYEDNNLSLKSYHSMLNYVPRIEFRTPSEYLYDLNNTPHIEYDAREKEFELGDNLFTLIYKEPRYQRCTYYLELITRLKEEEQSFNHHNGSVDYSQSKFNDHFKDYYSSERAKYSEIQVLKYLFRQARLDNEEETSSQQREKRYFATKLEDPNWHEVNNFVKFFDQQLDIYERSKKIKSQPCLKSLVVQLLCVMSNDFGLPSLNVNFNFRRQDLSLLNRSLSQASAFEITNDLNINISLNDLAINESRRWEKMIHPYIMFSADCETLIFLGTCMSRESHRFINPQTEEILGDDDSCLPRINSDAFMQLIRERTGIFDNFNKIVVEKKLDALGKVMGLDVRALMNDIKNSQIPEYKNYELTLDNCLKMMAIYLRFKANTPAIIMGETGCGKTSLIKYFAFLHLRKKIQENNLIHAKIHGGTTAQQIEKKLHDAEALSEENYKEFKANNLIQNDQALPITAILFLDEANTTEAIGLIKEIMCDSTCNGVPVKLEYGLKIIAAVNPYKKHSDEMIRKLEQAGLGFYISSAETTEKLGQIPMRQLVYRVQPLPTSLLPIVWDFGRLSTDVEKIYIKQMLITAASSDKSSDDLRSIATNEDEIKFLCSLIVESQTFMKSKNDECSFVSIRNVERVIRVTNWFLEKKELIFNRMNKRKIANLDDSYQADLKPLHRAFILALTVCYHSCLYKNETRLEYRRLLETIMHLDTRSEWILIEIVKCQNIFMDEIELEQMKNIARNSALLENVFMMIICIELRIPLFIVGKPGSSKSLAKSIVSRAMIGFNSKSELFKNLKETYFVNFQCSPLTTSEMIVKAFKEAADFQQNNDLKKSVSVVNLDEIGLAEGSESMPLKTLHSLLEDGACDDDEKIKDHHHVSVIGISNWALDPAKMNRGLFVSRGEVTTEDLISSAEGICNYDKQVYESIKPHINLIADAYLELCDIAMFEIKREFFGLRDYYSLIKMLYWFVRNDRELKWSSLEYSVRRNFNGVEKVDLVEPFRTRLFNRLPNDEEFQIDLIKSALKSEHLDTTSRYLLFLTENSSAIDIIQTYLISVVGLAPSNLTVIFGSSFRNDLQYTEVCRNISLIKYCMEVGKTVILLNSYNLYESLYDALNQYYYELHSQKFVDLGLGTHRIKCAVHANFRLIVIAEKAAVYDPKRFPIPLINRLEKHFLNAANILNQHQIELRDQLNEWCARIANKTKLNETFIGHHDDTTSAVILYLSQHTSTNILEQAKYIMLQCATPDSIVRYCGNELIKQDVRNALWSDYFEKQAHLSLLDLIQNHLSQQAASNLIQVTTHSKLTLSSWDKNRFEVDEICFLKSFDTQLQFEKKIDEFLVSNQRILLIQGDLEHKTSADLISCARHTIVEKFKQTQKKTKFIFLLINLPKENVKNFIGYQIGYWSCYHIDEIESELDNMPAFKYLKNRSIQNLLSDTLNKKTNMNLKTLLERLAHTACSLIVDTNLERTIKRIDLFTRLCNSSEEFVNAIVIRIILLLTEKEEKGYAVRSSKWLFNEAANLNTIKEYSTLRRACQYCFESKLSPLLGYLLAYLDQYSNLDVFANALNDASLKWKIDLWLSLIKNEYICELKYDDMRRKDDTNEEMRKFKCQSDWISKSFQDAFDQNKSFEPKLPFFWILVNQLNKLYENYKESLKQSSANICNELDQKCKKIKLDDTVDLLNADNNETLKMYETTISNLFQDTDLCLLLNKIVQDHKNNENFIQSIIESYVNDFVLINCSINSNKDLEIIKKLINQEMSNLNIDNAYRSVIKFTLPIVHYVYYNSIKDQIDYFLQYSEFEPEIADDFLKIRLKSGDIHWQSVSKTIQFFKEKEKSLEYFFDEYNQKISQERLSKLCMLISLVGESLKEIKNEFKSLIKQEYESLIVLLLFLDNMIETHLKDNNLIEKLNDLQHTLIRDYFNQDVDFTKKDTLKRLQDFIVYCYNQLADLNVENDWNENLNTFYFNVIEYLVLKDQAPDSDTIDLILQSITEKQITISNSKPFIIEQTYRGLLIQLVYKNDQQKVINYLRKWFNNHSIVGKNSSMIFESLNELAFLFIDCVHDQIAYEIQTKDKSLAYQIEKANGLCAELSTNKHYDLNSILMRGKIMHSTYDTNYLIAMAKLKFCLSTMAKVCNCQETYEKHKNEEQFIQFNLNLKQLLMKTFGLKNDEHKHGKTDTFFNYLIKDLIRRYGSSSIKYVQAESELNWMTPSSIIGNQEYVTDKYVLCPYNVYTSDINESKYGIFKKAIHSCFEEKNIKPILEIIKNDANDVEHNAYLGLSLYQNVTLLYKSIESSAKQIVEYFEPLEPKEAFRSLLSNSFEHNLKISQENWKHIDLNLLLIQLKFCVLYSPRENALLDPLRNLIINPAFFTDKYLPTMAQDTIYDVKDVLRSTAMYSCPNGHRYVIGDCTRPWVTSSCNECGAEIGGQSHRSSEGNIRIEDLVDNTIKGYGLQQASKLDHKPQSDRLLNQFEFQIERFFLHACLYLACGDKNEKASEVKSLIKLEKPDNVKQFFWEHMEKDLKLTCTILNLTMDELILLLHLIIYSFLNRDDYNRNPKKCSFDTKEERQNWEDNFNRLFLRNFLDDMRDYINRANNKIQSCNQSDNESQQSKIYFMAYELLVEPAYKTQYVYEDEKFWKFRPMVTFESMAIDLMNTSNLGEHFKILKKFNELKSTLKLVFHLPKIIKLINLLNDKLFRSIYKHHAQNKTIGEFFNEITLPKDWKMKDYDDVLDSFQAVWVNCRLSLKDYVKGKIADMMILLQTKYEFNKNSKLSTFLPTRTGDGLFTYSLLLFLSSVHNEMISFYQTTKQIDTTSFEDAPKNIELFQNENSIIKFDEDNDLFRLVQANFTYDLKNLKCVYNYRNIENQLINRYFRSKAKIDLNSIKLFEYADEISDLTMLKKLPHNDLLDLVTQQDINDEFKKINEISEALNILKVVINYASALSISSSESLSSFIKKIYSNDSNLIKQAEQILKTKIVENCNLGHLKHVWLILMMKKSVMYTKSNQDPFDYLNKAFKDEMDFEDALKMIDTNSLLVSVMLVLFQIITFDLTSLEGESIDIRKNSKISDNISSLENYSDFLIPENIRKLPPCFPDSVRTEENESEMLTQAKMENIFALWKLLCLRIN